MANRKPNIERCQIISADSDCFRYCWLLLYLYCYKTISYTSQLTYNSQLEYVWWTKLRVELRLEL